MCCRKGALGSFGEAAPFGAAVRDSPGMEGDIMAVSLNEEVRQDLVERGFSRRDFGRIAALLGIGASAPAVLAAPALAQPQSAARPAGKPVLIGANECWTGPFPAGVEAGARAMVEGNRYDPDHLNDKLVEVVSRVDGVPQTHIRTWPGSSGPLVSVVAAYCSPEKGLVTADPTFESAWRTAGYLNAPITKVPQPIGKGADVRGMLAANPRAGLYYVCSPNNPTGTITPLADIEWLLANKPADSMLLVDEAYIHFSEAQSAARLVQGRKDIIVLRTFSKLFGMAGVRLGLTFADPEVQKRIMLYNAAAPGLAITAMACGAAVYDKADLIRARRNEMIAAREETIAWLTAKGITVQPGAQANMFMVDWKKPAKEMQATLLAQNVVIGRNWPIWPNASRITVGSASEMAAFRAAVGKVYKA